MIANYKGSYYKIDLNKRPVEIWTYHPVEGFKRDITRKGTVYYEKFVELEEIDQIFEVGFSVCWNGQWCGINYSPQQDVLTLITNNKSFALSHNMYEFERGVFDCALPASAFKEYRMWTKKLHEKTGEHTTVSYEEFKKLWKEMVDDLIPPRENLTVNLEINKATDNQDRLSAYADKLAKKVGIQQEENKVRP